MSERVTSESVPQPVSSAARVRTELLRRAETMCRGAALRDEPCDQPDAELLHLLADMARRRRQDDFARACRERGPADASLPEAAAEPDAPGDVADLVRIGQRHLANQEWQAAADAFRRAVTLERAHEPACRGLAEALDGLGHREEAASAWCCVGAALAGQHRFAEAAIAYEAAQLRNPSSLNALVRLGLADIERARPFDAISRFEAVLATRPEHSVAHAGLAWASHLVGDRSRGWKEFALDRRKIGEREFDAPEWDGVSTLEGRTLFVWADQALGDTIQFVRYLTLVKRAGARVLFECSALLLPLIARMPCIDRIVGRGAPMPAYDAHVPLSALRGIFDGRGGDELGGDAYLSVESEEVRRWEGRLGVSDGRRRIGLVWSGEPTRVNGRAKFAPLTAFAPLAAVPDVRYISLQMGPQLSELLAPPSGLRIETVLTPTSSILDTSALLHALDLVITVDTLVAHLAGALGRPVWTLLPFAPDWRWRSEGERTPWYHSMRLFRPRRALDWMEMLGRVSDELAASEP